MHAPWRFCNHGQHGQHRNLTIVDIHKGGEDSSDSSNMYQVAEQAVPAKDTLSSAKYAGNNSSSSNGVEIWHNIRSVDVLEESQHQAQGY
jgi:hypothetical protein